MRSLQLFTLVLLLVATAGVGAAPSLGGSSSPGPAPHGDSPASAPTDIEALAREELEAAFKSGEPVREPAPPSGAEEGVIDFRCLPSCAADDARFLAVASGAALETLSRSNLDIALAAPAGTSSLRIGIFDADADSANGNWDVGSAPFAYTVYADRDRDGSGTQIVAGPFFAADLPNNGWFDFTVTTGPEAEAPSGNYFYRLAVDSLDESQTVLNSFKVRTEGVLTIEVSQQPFGFYAAIQSLSDAEIVFPSYPDPTPTTYDGSFDFYLDVELEAEDLVLWGGDLDRGAWDGSDQDTDDPDTPNAPFLPDWATPSAVFEGVADGENGTTGNPSDDVDPSGLGLYLQRSPSIEYEVIDPNGDVYPNPNPSGNQEWEQFRVTTGAFDRSTADLPADVLPAGMYVVRTRGVDMQNLNFWHFFHPVLCVETGGEPCEPLRPYLVGDTVFFDDDGDGVQDAGEPGIEGVTLELLNSNGTLLEQTVTGPGGAYAFDVGAGRYSVRVARTNFLPGQPLEGLASTTGDQLTATVVDDNVLSYDFGYAKDTGVCLPTATFETDGHGNPLKTGQIIDDEYANYGVHATSGAPHAHPLMIFDSAHPTGGDHDLGTPHQDFGGPGVGAGGAAGAEGENSQSEGKVLILSEDGDASDPDDNGGGGVMIVTFKDPVELHSLRLLDVDADETVDALAFDDSGNVIAQASSRPLGDNSAQWVILEASRVSRLDVVFSGSGALAQVVFCPPHESGSTAGGEPAGELARRSTR